MKILLINPLVRGDDAPRHIPFGLGILANIADMLGHQIAMMDLNAFRLINTAELIRKEISADAWDFIGIGGLHSQYKEIKRVLPIARKSFPEAMIVAGGSYISHLPKETMLLNPEIDVGCIGEGEETFKELLDTIDSQRWSQIKGIVYREDGEIIMTEPRPLLQDLDKLPYPAYHLIPLEVYFANSSIMLSPESYVSKRRMSFVWERGCPRQCKFCSHAGMSRWDQNLLYGKEKVREMDKEYGFQHAARWPTPKYCVENVLYCRIKYGIDFASILDENMLSNRKWTEEFCNLYMEEGLHDVVPWGSLGDAPSVATHPDIVRVLREAGCKYISFGFESGSDKVLINDIGKGQLQRHEQIAVDSMIKNGLSPVATFMLGNPTEDINDILETVYFWIRNRIEVDPFICTPYPGSMYFYKYQDFILEQYDDRLVYAKNHPGRVDAKTLEKWKLEALERFLLELDDATDLTAHVSQVFDFGDLLTLKNLMKMKDMGRLLKLAHKRKWVHEEKWKRWCGVCKAEEQLSIPQEVKVNGLPQVRQGIAFS